MPCPHFTLSMRNIHYIIIFRMCFCKLCKRVCQTTKYNIFLDE